MHALIPATPTPAALVLADLTDALEYAEAEKAETTRRAYRSDWRIFSAWCAARGLDPLPAAPATVAGFLAAEAKSGVKASTIARRCAAIGYAHKLAGHREPPINAEPVKTVMRSIRRTIGTTPKRKAAAMAGC